MTLPPAGWYPDPGSDANIRFWDGAGWTDRVQPKSVPPPPPPPQGGAQPPQPPPPTPTYGGPSPYAQHPGPPPPGYTPSPLVDPWGYGAAPPAATAAGRLGPDQQILSGWWRRVGGYLIDSLIAGIPAGIAWSITFLVISSNGGSILNQDAIDDVLAQFEDGTTPTNSDMFDMFASGFWTALAVSAVVWLMISLVNGVYLISKNGQTIGDTAVNNRKVMAGRTVPTFPTALARWLIPNVLFSLIGNIVPLGFLVSWADYLWPLWDGKSQTLHDKMVRTYVERADLAGPPVPRR